MHYIKVPGIFFIYGSLKEGIDHSRGELPASLSFDLIKDRFHWQGHAIWSGLGHGVEGVG
jgi:hypothetical protein